jgi:hypothetical protein
MNIENLSEAHICMQNNLKDMKNQTDIIRDTIRNNIRR